MICSNRILFVLFILILIEHSNGHGITRRMRNAAEVNGHRGVTAPILGPEIDLESIDGIEQVTKLVLIKTDSLPNDSEERIDGRFLTSLMEGLYTGLRKPFKSVSADILGIFPTFDEIKIQCEPSSSRKDMDRDETVRIKRNVSSPELTLTSVTRINKNMETNEEITNYENVTDREMNEDTSRRSYKSSIQVCKAVTSDCLSMDDLVRVLPPSITTFDKVVVRICPIMLFRIMNDLCHKSNNPFVNYQLGDRVASESFREDIVNMTNHKTTYLSNLLREKQILQNGDLSSKKPQKLHKKLKTQTAYKGKGSVVNLQQQGNVDEQLLKIRLKLTEPSIEKVWIFSLLFVILSIVVSMGGLIVLPFVRKTTRRRILTLFEGLAVGGLAGSATLHMFPQAFGLVDENYHKYFWRIFVVFFGIYVCYLCERILKIIKVMRSRMKGRSRGSLDGMEFRLGPYLGSELNKSWAKSKQGTSSQSREKTSSSKRTRTSENRNLECASFIEMESSDVKTNRQLRRQAKCSKENLEMSQQSEVDIETDQPSFSIGNGDSLMNFDSPNDTRQRLLRCLKSVKQQFSPVYAVSQINGEDSGNARDDYRLSSRSFSKSPHDSREKKGGKVGKVLRRVKLPFIFKLKKERKHKRRIQKHREPEVVVYDHRMIMRQRHDINRGYIQDRLSRVGHKESERHDRDSAARMSVDTVAWMIVFGDAVLNVIDGLSIGAAFERNILAGISISVAVMLEEVTHRLGTFAVLIRAGMSMQQSLLCTFLSACALFPGLIVGILLSDATEDATPYIFCAAGGIFLYMALVDVMKEMNRSIENAMRKDLRSTLQIFALQNLGIILAVIFLSFLALYEQAMDFVGYQEQYKQP